MSAPFFFAAELRLNALTTNKLSRAAHIRLRLPVLGFACRRPKNTGGKSNFVGVVFARANSILAFSRFFVFYAGGSSGRPPRDPPCPSLRRSRFWNVIGQDTPPKNFFAVLKQCVFGPRLFCGPQTVRFRAAFVFWEAAHPAALRLPCQKKILFKHLTEHRKFCEI